MVYLSNTSKIPPRGKSNWIADDVRERIISGNLNGKLPSERDLASSYGVNFKTVAKALAILVESGLLRRSAPHGTFVNENHQSSAIGGTSAKNVTLLIKTQGHLFENFAGALIEQLGARGHHSAVSSINPETGQEKRMPRISRTLEKRSDSLVVDTDMFCEKELRLIATGAPKVIHLARRALELGFNTNADFVLSDYWLGAYIATKHLIDSGHKRVLLLTHNQKPVPITAFRHETHYLLLAGYRDAMIEAGLEKNIKFFGELGEKHAKNNQSKLKELFDSNTPPDAVFACQDNRIVRNANILQESGLDLRKDVVGYNNTPWSSEWEIPFTSVSIRENKMAEAIVEHVEGTRSGITYIKPELVVRGN